MIEQLEMEGYERMTERRWQREQGRRDATEDMSEDLSEGEREKGDILGDLPQSGEFGDFTPRKKTFQRNFSDVGQLWSDDDNKSKKLYIVLIRYSFFSLYNLVVFLCGELLHTCTVRSILGGSLRNCQCETDQVLLCSESIKSYIKFCSLFPSFIMKICCCVSF